MQGNPPASSPKGELHLLELARKNRIGRHAYWKLAARFVRRQYDGPSPMDQQPMHKWTAAYCLGLSPADVLSDM
jgi:hypothetical protein